MSWEYKTILNWDAGDSGTRMKGVVEPAFSIQSTFPKISKNRILRCGSGFSDLTFSRGIYVLRIRPLTFISSTLPSKPLLTCSLRMENGKKDVSVPKFPKKHHLAQGLNVYFFIDLHIRRITIFCDLNYRPFPADVRKALKNGCLETSQPSWRWGFAMGNSGKMGAVRV